MSDRPLERSGVIHDIGYRGYDGQREADLTLARTLFVTGMRHAYGLGRSGRSKVLPFLLLGLNVLPALIIVGVVTIVELDELPLSYTAYTSQLQMVVSLFAAAQAPVLFSRDLRHRSIVLYLARPLSPALFALTRWASLATAVLVFTLLPTLVLYAGALLAGLDAGQETPLLLKSLALQVLRIGLFARDDVRRLRGRQVARDIHVHEHMVKHRHTFQAVGFSAGRLIVLRMPSRAKKATRSSSSVTPRPGPLGTVNPKSP